jgi:hypothetical protein
MAKANKPPVREDESAKSELIRRFKTNPAIFIGTLAILIIVVIAFVFLPAFVPAGGGPGADLTFGYYEKIPITFRRDTYFAMMYDNYVEMMRGNFNTDDADYLNFEVWQNSYYSTVIHTGILQEMKRAGYEAPNKVVDQGVAQQYLTLYRQKNDSGKIALWRTVKEILATEKYLQDQYELLKPPEEEEFVLSMAASQRRFEGTAFNLRDYPETEVAAFAAQNSALFLSIHLSRITVTSGEREAQQILASVRDGTSSFEDAARNQSQDNFADRGGDMGIQMAYELATTVRDEAEREKILALRKGELSGLVANGENWVFFRAEDDPVPADVSDPAQVEKIRSYILLFERGRMDDYFIRKAEELRARAMAGGDDGFTASIEEAGLGKFSFGPLAINYGNQNFFPMLASIEGFTDISLTNFASTDSFWQTAFSTPLETVSEPLVLGDQVLLLRPLEETEPDSDAGEASKLAFERRVLEFTGNVSSFFLQSPKLQDQFWETYRRYFIGE